MLAEFSRAALGLYTLSRLMIAVGLSALTTLAAPACSSAESSFALKSGMPCAQVAGWPKRALRHKCIPQALRVQAAFGDTSKVVWATTRAGFDMLVHRSNDGVSGVIRSTGTWEYDHLRAMEARRPPPATSPKRSRPPLPPGRRNPPTSRPEMQTLAGKVAESAGRIPARAGPRRSHASAHWHGSFHLHVLRPPAAR